MSKAIRNLVLIALCIFLSILGCRKSNLNDCSNRLQVVFGDFSYAGSVHDLKEISSLPIKASTTFPSELKPGVKYIFNHGRLSSTYEFESKTIPTRLEAQGIQFRPLEKSDFGYPEEGGPLFDIELVGSCKGHIFNVVDRRVLRDRKLSQLMASEACVLELSQQ